jgi:iron complex transport system substrate-binding protein
MRQVLFPILVIVLGFFFKSTAVASVPERIVSTHLCADQLLLLLEVKEKIVSLSYFSSDPNFSNFSSEAIGFHKNHGLVEELLPFNPDLVITGEYSARPTTAMLKRIGIPVIQLPVSNNFNEIVLNIRRVAAAVGKQSLGEELIEKFIIELNKVSTFQERKPVAVLYWPNGYTPGNNSLAAEVLRYAGFRSLGQKYGTSSAGYMALERLVLSQPDIVVIPQRGSASLAGDVPHHRALRLMFNQGRLVKVSDRLWTCGGPAVIEALQILRHIRKAIR